MNLDDYSAWLGFWWRRWNIRGVQFRSKAGGQFANVFNREFTSVKDTQLFYINDKVSFQFILVREPILDAVSHSGHISISIDGKYLT